MSFAASSKSSSVSAVGGRPEDACLAAAVGSSCGWDVLTPHQWPAQQQQAPRTAAQDHGRGARRREASRRWLTMVLERICGIKACWWINPVWMSGWTDGRMDGRMDGWTDE
eukprot:287947-Chlamydomonas_euryale.AAC.1